jgi:hypothetical protein
MGSLITRFSHAGSWILMLLHPAAALACSSAGGRTETPSQPAQDHPAPSRAAIDAANRALHAECSTKTPIWKREVDARDGIDRCEAHTLVDAFNRAHPLGCGAYGPPLDAGDHWSVPVWVGTPGTPIEPLRIHKLSGRLTAPDPTCGGAPCEHIEASSEQLLEARSRAAPVRTEPVRFRDGVAISGDGGTKKAR